MSEALLDIAVDLATRGHAGQKDKVGEPYITHPLRVAEACASADEKIVALLHDVVEDTEVTLEDLRGAGMPENIIAAVDAISKRKGEKNIDYLDRVKANALARSVKLKDLADNFSPPRFDMLNKDDKERLSKKYSFAIEYLK